MVVLSKPPPPPTATITDRFSCPGEADMNAPRPQIPLVDLSTPDAKSLIIKACEDFGFFKVVNHGVPSRLFYELEAEASAFFSLHPSLKEAAAPPSPFGYGNKWIGRNGDIGQVEYLLLSADSHFQNFPLTAGKFCSAMKEYISAVRSMACDILELMADGLKIQPKETLSKLLMDEQSDSVFRINHYPPCLENQSYDDDQEEGQLIRFGEHTDPQIISVLRSNSTPGLQISLKDGTWITVPPDQDSFFINVGDSLQVMTNGRFKSVRHRVVTNGRESRLSTIYFGGPPLSEKIAPLPSLLMKGKESSLYKEFTWFEYKSSAYNSRLADNRLENFQHVQAASS
ncbi:hypothetical protein MLD38_021953 [Melastoma candidum]|uniref:Uncharacterized protein n=1 Tax=Melastoma candidum TaxID=119954 RepID=A0ACB9QIV8_9MYRT|nr:hypothetical protein MLD38_021953 [Melastoma candidum]